MTEQYVGMLVQSLEKKEQLLEQIVTECDKQTSLVKETKLDVDAFDQAFDKKAGLIAQIDLLDEGFDSVFERVSPVLATAEGKQTYAEEIRKMQTLIKKITDLNMHIQTSEQRNKATIEQYFARERAQIKQGREGSSAAMNYYLNMKNRQIVPPHFYDTKN